MKIRLKNQVGMIKECPAPSFSWTTFFFGLWPAVFRADWKYAGIMLIASMFTFGLSQIFFWFKYNELHVKGLLEKGYEPADNESMMILVSKGLIAMPQND